MLGTLAVTRGGAEAAVLAEVRKRAAGCVGAPPPSPVAIRAQRRESLARKAVGMGAAPLQHARSPGPAASCRSTSRWDR